MVNPSQLQEPPKVTSRHSQHYLGLIWALAKRDIQASYRRSFLGPLWAVIPPIMTMVVFNLLRGVVDIQSEGVPYVIFSFAGILPWTFFNSIVTGVTPGILANSTLLRKIAIPPEMFAAVAVFKALFDLAIASVILVGMMIWFQTPFTWALLWIPVLLFLLMLLGWAIGLAVASVGIYRRDILKGQSYLLQLWFFVSPIVYPLSSVPEGKQDLYRLNPLVGLIDGFRRVLISGKNPDLNMLAYSILITLLLTLIIWPVFRLMSRYFVDVL